MPWIYPDSVPWFPNYSAETFHRNIFVLKWPRYYLNSFPSVSSLFMQGHLQWLVAYLSNFLNTISSFKFIITKFRPKRQVLKSEMLFKSLLLLGILLNIKLNNVLSCYALPLFLFAANLFPGLMPLCTLIEPYFLLSINLSHHFK